MAKKLSKEVLSELVYDQIVKMLLNKDLQPGEKILKKELADQLGVSMTPVTEALSRLLLEGILEQRERREIYVKNFTNSDMIELFEVRAGLEATALIICMDKLNSSQWDKIVSLFDEFPNPVPEKMYSAYQKRDREFHSSILKMSNNNLILEFIQRCDFIIRCYHKGLIRSPNETLPEHLEIIEAIKNNNADLAQQKLIAHHWKTRARLLEMPDSSI